MTNLEKVKKFIKDNGIDLSGSGSDLNSACTALAGFICHVIMSDDGAVEYGRGTTIISELKLDIPARIELERVFEFAWDNNYEEFWDTDQAKEEYVF
jgi:hypothetical protein